MKKWIAAALVLAVVTGCEKSTFSESKAEAQSRWLQARAVMFCQLARNRLEAGQVDAAAESVGRALAIQPDFPPARLLAAKVLIQQGKYAEAAARLRGEMDACPDSAEIAYLLGVALEKSGELTEALASYRRAYGLEETNLAAVQAAAEVLVALGEPKQAQMLVETFLPKASQDAGMQELAGRLAAMHGQCARAAGYYARACDLDYHNVCYQECLARARFGAGQFDAALDVLSELARREGYTPPAWVHMMMGDCHMAAGRSAAAFEDYFRASELAPKEAAVWRSLARSALAMKDDARAVLAARKALQLDGQDAESAAILGYALIRNGQAEEACKVLRHASDGHPTDGTLLCLLGRAHAAAGDQEQALRCYTAALEADPTSVVARELLAAGKDKRVSRLE